MKKLFSIILFLFAFVIANAQDMEHYTRDTVTVVATTNTKYIYPGDKVSFSTVASYPQKYNLYTILNATRISGTIASTVVYVELCADMTCNVTFPVDTFTLTDVATVQKFQSKKYIDGSKFRYRIETGSSTSSIDYQLGYYVKREL